MDMNLRRIYRKLSDEGLMRIAQEALVVQGRTDYFYRNQGGIPVHLAEDCCVKVEMGLVARAIMTERTISGKGHSLIIGSNRASPQSVSRHFGKTLRENRGVER